MLAFAVFPTDARAKRDSPQCVSVTIFTIFRTRGTENVVSSSQTKPTWFRRKPHAHYSQFWTFLNF